VSLERSEEFVSFFLRAKPKTYRQGARATSATSRMRGARGPMPREIAFTGTVTLVSILLSARRDFFRDRQEFFPKYHGGKVEWALLRDETPPLP